MNRTDRLMAIITFLQTKKLRSAGQIAERFQISRRTVFRDLKALSEIGIPVHYEPDKGYSIYGDYFLPPISLSAEEANALSLAEPLVLRFADKSVLENYQSALAKIKLVLGHHQQKSMEQSSEGSAHYVPNRFAKLMPSTDYLPQLQTAIIDKQIVHLQYENSNGERSLRDVEPIGLTFYSLNWHLIAWCHLRKEYRDFRTNRIHQLKVTIREFIKKDHIKLEEYLAEQQRKFNETFPEGLT